MFDIQIPTVLWIYRGDLKFDHLKFGNICNPDFFKVRFQMVRFSNGRALAMAIAIVLSGFQMVFDKMAAICLDFKWLSFRISDPT